MNTGDHIKNIFIRNAHIGDEITIDGRIVKARNNVATEEEQLFNNLRVIFTDFANSDFERLDSVFLDAQTQKKECSECSLLVLARGTSIEFKIS
jgi:hypothetical protein